jgi:hypothetical protein
MEHEGSLPSLQGPATAIYPEPHQYSSHFPILFPYSELPTARIVSGLSWFYLPWL